MIYAKTTQAICLFVFGYFHWARGYHDSISNIGQSASQRELADSLSGKVLIPDPQQTLSEDGKIISFNYYSDLTEVDIKFQIWRPVSGDDYRLIYQSSTVTTSDSTGSFSYDVTSNEWAKAGDTVGIYVADENPLPYTSSTCALMEHPLYASSASVGDTKSFNELTTSECRAYSLQLEVVYETTEATNLTCTYLTADDSYQYLTSPNYDGSTQYTDEEHYCWVFESGSNDKAVRILFDSIDFEDENPNAGECAGDFLEFHDGEDFWDDILDEVCGTTYPVYGINSTQQYMYLRMVSDDNGVNGLGFQIQYKAFVLDTSSSNNKKSKDDSLSVAIILCIVFAIIALLLIIPIIILWIRTKRQRDRERREKLKDNDFLELEKNRPSAWSPDVTRPKTPRPQLDIEAHKANFLKSRMARNVPDAPSYHQPRQPEGVENVKIKHWSKLTAGVRWNPIRKQFKVADSSVSDA